MKLLGKGYTEKELRLISMFGYGDLINHIDASSALYRMCVEKAFIDDMKGPHVEALRRGYCALAGCKIYRLTDEFENLITF